MRVQMGGGIRHDSALDDRGDTIRISSGDIGYYTPSDIILPGLL